MKRDCSEILKKATLIFAAVLAIAGCRRPVPFTMPEETEFSYDAEIGGTRVFASIDTIADGTASGHFYAAGEGPVAPRQYFTARTTRKQLLVTVDGVTTKTDFKDIKYNKYEVPEFILADTRPFKEKFSKVSVTSDIVYGHAQGYWSSLPGVEAEVSKAFTNGYIKSFKRRDLDLTLDLYRPEEPEGRKPLILFLHGGAFYVGDKKEPAYVDFCRHFASMGYVTASMNYRMGFHVGKGEIERAGYVALQDAHAAMRFLVSKADEYGIDVNRLFVAGSSAGSITALNLAFMTEKDRPESTHGAKGLFNGNDLGEIATSGNSIKQDFSILAVANMWGAVSSTGILKNSPTDIISFHGDADNIVPYSEGYPFASAGDAISKMLSDKMYGSVNIDKAAKSLGRNSRMYSFAGDGHALNTTGKEKKPNAKHEFIKGKMAAFFYDEMVPSPAEIVQESEGVYSVSGAVVDESWKIDGGFILADSDGQLKVLWMEDAPEKVLTASGTYPNGIGWVDSYDFQMQEAEEEEN